MKTEKENYSSTPAELRKFGLIVGGVFLVISLWPLVFRGEAIHLWAIIVAATLLVPAALVPMWLHPIFKAWMWIGGKLGWINTRIILGIGFFGVFTPMGITMRLLGKDPLHRKLDPLIPSYRISKIARPGTDLYKQH